MFQKSVATLAFITATAPIAAHVQAAVKTANQAISYDFNIPEEDLGAALRAFAKVSGQQLVYDNAVVTSKTSHALIGSFTAEAGLRALLADSGLAFRRGARDVFIISGDAQPQPNSDTQADSDVIVTGHTGPTDVANNIRTPMIETTQSIDLVTSEDLAVANIKNFNEVARLDSGGYQTPIRSGYTSLYFRGFVSNMADFPLKIDGFRSSNVIAPELFLYDSLQLVKGSTSTNYGPASPGGVEVAISKRPKSEFGGTSSIEAGSYGHYGVNFDVYGPLAAQGGLAGRLVAVINSDDSAFQFIHQRRWTIAPSLRYSVTDQDELVLLSSYTQIHGSTSTGFPLQVDLNGPNGTLNGANYSIPALSFSQLGGAAPWSNDDKMYYNVSTLYTHTFDAGFARGWKFTLGVNRFEIQRPHIRLTNINASSPISADHSQPTDLYLYFGNNRTRQWAGDVSLTGDIDAFGHTHTFYVGADYTQNLQGFVPYAGTYLPGSATGFNLFANNWDTVPGYSNVQDMVARYGDPTFVYAFDTRTVNSGAETTWLLRPMDSLSVNVGGRYSKSTEAQKTVTGYPDSIENPLPAYSATRPAQSAFTYQLGASYEIRSNLHGYVSYGTSFMTGNAFAFTNSTDPVGRFLGNIKGETREAGLKGQAASKLFSWSLDLFQTSITNAFQRDPQHPKYYIIAGAQQARGAEFELKGEIEPGLKLLLSANTTKNVFTDGPLRGFRSPFAPKFGLSAFTTYELQGGALKGLGAGAGWVHKTNPHYTGYQISTAGTTYLDYSNAIKPTFDEFDARLFYNLANWQFEVSGTNILNEHHASPRLINFPGGQIFMSDPATVVARVTRTF